MNWKVYRKDDPNTYPEIDCFLLVYCGMDECSGEPIFKICTWDDTWKRFLYGLTYNPDECFYAYIGYLPYVFKILHPKKCGYVDENGVECACPYGFDDDGYCLNDEFQCKYVKVVNEYVIETKRIWQEFQ